MIPNFIIYLKKESLLKAALAYVEELRDHHMPMLRAGDLHELRLMGILNPINGFLIKMYPSPNLKNHSPNAELLC